MGNQADRVMHDDARTHRGPATRPFDVGRFTGPVPEPSAQGVQSAASILVAICGAAQSSLRARRLRGRR